MINRATILGRIGFIESKIVNNTTFTKLSVATNEKWKDKNGEKQEKTTWHNVVGFNKLGEIMAKYATVGDLAYVEGRIAQNKYKSESGEEKISFSITAAEFKIINSNNKTAENTSQAMPKNDIVESSGNFLNDDIPW